MTPKNWIVEGKNRIKRARGVKNDPKKLDIIYEWSLICLTLYKSWYLKCDSIFCVHLFFTVFWRTTIKNPVKIPFHSAPIPIPTNETPSGPSSCTQTQSTLCGHMRCTPSTRSFGTQTTAPKTDASAASTSTKANTKPAGVNIFTNEKLYSGKSLEASYYTKKFFWW